MHFSQCSQCKHTHHKAELITELWKSCVLYIYIYISITVTTLSPASWKKEQEVIWHVEPITLLSMWHSVVSNRPDADCTTAPLKWDQASSYLQDQGSDLRMENNVHTSPIVPKSTSLIYFRIRSKQLNHTNGQQQTRFWILFTPGSDFITRSGRMSILTALSRGGKKQTL